jgi:hypothetical protein
LVDTLYTLFRIFFVTKSKHKYGCGNHYWHSRRGGVSATSPKTSNSRDTNILINKEFSLIPTAWQP